MNLSNLESIIGVSFKDKDILKQALVHRSYINENRSAGLMSNERLEYLGDTVLQLVITDYVYRTFPDMDEGKLTWLRASLVNGVSCFDVATKLGLVDYMMISKGIAKDGPRAIQNPAADALEAVIGAIYLDQGFDAARNFVLKNFTPLTEKILEEGLESNAKTMFQTAAQKEANITPSYKLISDSGPAHDPTFVMGVYLGEELVGKGEGKSKQDAEQEAARAALKAKGW